MGYGGAHIEVNLSLNVLRRAHSSLKANLVTLKLPLTGQTAHFEPQFLERLPFLQNQDYQSPRLFSSVESEICLKLIWCGFGRCVQRKNCDLAPGMPTTLSESSVDSFLKGVRSEVEMFKVEENKNGVTGNNEALLNEDKQVMPDEIKNEVVGLRLVKVGWKVKKEVVVKEPAEFHKDVLMLMAEAQTMTDLNNVEIKLPLEEFSGECNNKDDNDEVVEEELNLSVNAPR